jgi:hypothetical protein
MDIPWSLIGILSGSAWAIVAIVKSFQKNKIKLKEMELKKLEMEVEKQNREIKLLEEENEKYDRIIKND